MTVSFYADTYFLLNSAMDAVMLAVTALICAEKTRPARLIGASLLGGAAALGLWFWPAHGILRLLFGIGVYPLLIFCAFGKKTPRRFGVLCLFGFLTSLFLGGAVLAVSYIGSAPSSPRVTLLVFFVLTFSAFGLWSLWGHRLHRRLAATVVSLSVRVQDKQEEFYGLVDSGSFLRDPASGDPVILLKASHAAALLSAEELARLQSGGALPGKETANIPVRTVSGEGFMTAFRPDLVRFYPLFTQRRKKGTRRVLIALDFSGGGFAGCPCLIPLTAL